MKYVYIYIYYILYIYIYIFGPLSGQLVHDHFGVGDKRAMEVLHSRPVALNRYLTEPCFYDTSEAGSTGNPFVFFWSFASVPLSGSYECLLVGVPRCIAARKTCRFVSWNFPGQDKKDYGLVIQVTPWWDCFGIEFAFL